MKKVSIIFAILALLVFAYFVKDFLINMKKPPVISEDLLPSSKNEKEKNANNVTGRSLKPVETILNIDESEEPNDIIKQILSNKNFIEAGFQAASIKSMNLTAKEFLVLTSFLKEKPLKSEDNLSYYSFKNEIIVAMLENGAFIEELGYQFSDILQDKKQEPIIIDYITQYIPDYFDRRWKKNTLIQEQQQMVDDLYALLNNPNDSLAGTALKSLERISQSYSVVDKQILQTKALEMLNNTSLTQASRSESIVYLSQFKDEKISEEIERLSFDNSTPVMLRMMALNSFSKTVSENETEKQNLLKRINEEILTVDTTDKRLLTAAKLITSNLNKN